MPATASSIFRPRTSSQERSPSISPGRAISCFWRSIPARLGSGLRNGSRRAAARCSRISTRRSISPVLWVEPLELGKRTARHILPEGVSRHERAVRLRPEPACRRSTRAGARPRGQEPRARALSPRRRARRHALGADLFGLDFPNPVGMAAGFDKDARVPRQLLAMGFGFVEVGTLTPRAQSGNPPRACSAPAPTAPSSTGSASTTRARTRRSRGCEAGRTGIVGVNIGAGRDSADRIGDYVSGIERMAAVASYFTVNISSPNTPGLRDLQAPEALDALLTRVLEARAALPSNAAASGQARARPRRRRPARGGARDPGPRRRRHRRVEHDAVARRA